jgi:hypothetical protein
MHDKTDIRCEKRYNQRHVSVSSVTLNVSKIKTIQVIQDNIKLVQMLVAMLPPVTKMKNTVYQK